MSFASASPWPAVTPLDVEFSSGTAAPTLVTSPSGNVVQVQAPPGTITTARLSAYVGSGDLPNLSLWRWMEAAGLSNAALQSLVTTGQHWMFTPFLELTFVHAVRTPNPPVSTAAAVTREAGKTYALFSDTIDVDFQGSSKLDLLAAWTTPFDDGVSPGGAVPLPGSAHLADIPLELGSPPQQSVAVSDVRYDFGDTKYRLLDYQPQATSRYLEYFQEFTSVVLTTSPTTINSAGLAAGATIVSATIAQGTPPVSSTVTFQPGVDYLEDDSAGTLALASGSSIPGVVGSGGAVDVRWVAPPVTALSGAVPVSVASTARPAAPDIAFVLPIFSFDTTTSSTSVTSTRSGNALRVYLNRPWYSSGDGEQLGVVVYPGPGSPPGSLAPFVSGYGRDPIRTTNLQTRQPALSDFTLAASTQGSINLEETSAALVGVAGHTVEWEGTYHFLWYADIAIDSSSPLGGSDAYSYFPFVRMALVRYQPNSLDGYWVSKVVVADFAQVAPDRFATLTFPTDTTVSVTVSGVGAAAGSQLGVPPSSMTATVQVQQPAVTDPDLQWVDAAGSEVTLASSEAPGYAFSWSGTAELPAARGSQPMRIRLTESEHYLFVPPSGTPSWSSRVVYLDTLDI